MNLILLSTGEGNESGNRVAFNYPPIWVPRNAPDHKYNPPKILNEQDWKGCTFAHQTYGLMRSRKRVVIQVQSYDPEAAAPDIFSRYFEAYYVIILLFYYIIGGGSSDNIELNM
jgi:hypothetical protein